MCKNSENKPLKWGILGCGRISNDFVYSMLRKCEKPNVVQAVATSNSVERAQKFVDGLQIPNDQKEAIKAYGSYEELLDDPECEIIYIGILNITHCRWTLAALEKGKHVLCEKPMGLSKAESELIAQKAREKGLFVMEGFWSRFFPVYQMIGKIVKSNQLGAVKTISAHFGTIPADSRFRLDLSESPCMDIGIYTVMFTMFCLGDQMPTLVRAHAAKNSEGCDISGNIYLEFAGGEAKASLMWATESICPCSAFIAFEKGIIQIPDWFYCPTRIRIIKGKAYGETMDTEDHWFPLKDDPDLYLFPNGSGMRYEIDHVYECIRAGLKESPVMSLKHSIRLSDLMENIRHQIGVEFPQDRALNKCYL